MEDPDWTRVLSQLYKRQGEFKLPLREGSDERIAVEPTDLGDIDKEKQYQEEKLSENIIFLEEQGLITTEKTEYETTNVVDGRIIQENPACLVLELTKKGFDVAHDREQNKNREQINKALVVLTWILAGAGSIQAVTAIVSLQGFNQKFMTGFSVILLPVVYIGIQQTAN